MFVISRTNYGKIRGKGKSGIARALYVTVVGRRVVILRVFVKKTQKTPPGEVALALSKTKEIDHGQENVGSERGTPER